MARGAAAGPRLAEGCHSTPGFGKPDSPVAP